MITKTGFEDERECLEEVEDHCSTRMMSLSDKKPKVNYNIMMDGLTVKRDSLLHDMMTSLSFQNITEKYSSQ